MSGSNQSASRNIDPFHSSNLRSKTSLTQASNWRLDLHVALLLLILLSTGCNAPYISATITPTPTAIINYTQATQPAYPLTYPYPDSRYPLPPSNIYPLFPIYPYTEVTRTFVPFPPYIPPRFQIFDLDFVDEFHGWALGITYSSMSKKIPALRRTTDGGQTWGTIPTPEIINDLWYYHIQFANPNLGWLYGPALFFTYDGGQTWDVNQSVGEIIALEPLDDTVWMVERHCGENTHISECTYSLLREDNEEWASNGIELPSSVSQLVRTDLQEAWLLDMILGDEPHNRVFFTSDGGQTWEEPNLSTPLNLCEFMEIDPEGQLWVLCGGPGATSMQGKRLFISRDNGKNWSLIAEAAPGDNAINNLPLVGHIMDFNVVSSLRAFIALGRSTLLCTDDGGNTWDYAIKPADLYPLEGVKHVDFVDSLHGWATTMQNIIFRTQDGGITWEKIEIP